MPDRGQTLDKAIFSAFMIIISMVMAVLLFNVAYPAVMESSSVMNIMTSRADERLKSHVETIHAAGEIDSSGLWQDTNGNGLFDAFIWVKNVGDTRIVPIENLDVFFGPEGNFTRIPHQSVAGGSYPYWSYELENAGQWTPSATVKIMVHYTIPLAQDRYFIKVILPNGVATEYFFSM